MLNVNRKVACDLSVSVGIPRKNNSWQLDGVLRSIFNQSRPVDERIIVDDNSTKIEGNMIKQLADFHKAKYFKLSEPKTFLQTLGRRKGVRYSLNSFD